jgi:hypothetical protein
MRLIDETIACKSRSDRIEIFPFYDIHCGKRNCMEHSIIKQRAEILRREQMPNRHVRVILGGDQLNSINPSDIKRFDFSELADWFVQGTADNTRDMLSDIVGQEIKHAVQIFKPVRHLIIGALEGNHEKAIRTRQNLNVHAAFCRSLDIPDLSDECLIRFRISCKSNVRTFILYMRHGYGAGRTAGAEPNKLQRMLDEWEVADVCLSGHSHSFCILPPKPILYVPSKGALPPKMLIRHRFAANPGCWLSSHPLGSSTYESMAAYPARPMMTLKIVIFPFWHSTIKYKGSKYDVSQVKTELRSYAIT